MSGSSEGEPATGCAGLRDRVQVRSVDVLYGGWGTLRRTVLDYRRNDGNWETQTRETYDHGDGAAVLPYDAERGTVLLVRQLRLTAFNAGDFEPLLEACAGLLDGDEPAKCALREAEEELGYRLRALEPVAMPFMSPGSLTERVALFTARYAPGDRFSDGGGHPGETEDVEVVEIPLAAAYAAVRNGRIKDAKTIILIQHLMLAKGD